MTIATYDSLIADIYTLTNRPDLAAETALALRKATLKAHMADFWKNDLTSSLITLPVIDPASAVSYRYTLDLSDTAVYPLLRKVQYIKEYNAVPTGQEIQLLEKDIDRILDHYLLEDINYWTQAGQQASMRTNKALGQITVGYYRYPDVSSTVFDSWIAVQFPDLLVEEATSRVFATIGKLDEARAYASSFTENIHLITMSQVQSA